ncbi:helix-turn-helix domain-containing protein [Mycobacterium sp. pW045]|uniref:helix-turn-helix domain-containing protein n=1 Tax=Mycobacterium sp. pW045 TaxID=3238984 RepID=UPI00351AD246
MELDNVEGITMVARHNQNPKSLGVSSKLNTFIKVPDWLTGTNLSMTNVMVYAALKSFDFSDKNGSAWPSIETLMEKSMAGRTAVQESLNILEGLGLIRTERRYLEGGLRISNKYHFIEVDQELHDRIVSLPKAEVRKLAKASVQRGETAGQSESSTSLPAYFRETDTGDPPDGHTGSGKRTKGVRLTDIGGPRAGDEEDQLEGDQAGTRRGQNQMKSKKMNSAAPWRAQSEPAPRKVLDKEPGKQESAEASPDSLAAPNGAPTLLDGPNSFPRAEKITADPLEDKYRFAGQGAIFKGAKPNERSGSHLQVVPEPEPETKPEDTTARSTPQYSATCTTVIHGGSGAERSSETEALTRPWPAAGARRPR